MFQLAYFQMVGAGKARNQDALFDGTAVRQVRLHKTRVSEAKDVSGIPDRLNYPDTYTGLNLNYIEALKNMGNPNDARSHKLIFATRQ